MPTQLHSVSVAAAIVRDDSRVLLVRRADNGRWEPPGGVLELDEPIEAGLTREVAEETGLSVEIETLSGVYKNITRASSLSSSAVTSLPETYRQRRGFRLPLGERRRTRRTHGRGLRRTCLGRRQLHGNPTIRTHDGVSLVV